MNVLAMFKDIERLKEKMKPIFAALLLDFMIWLQGQDIEIVHTDGRKVEDEDFGKLIDEFLKS